MSYVFWGITLAFVMGAVTVIAVYLTGKDWSTSEWYHKLMAIVIALMALAGLGMVFLLHTRIPDILTSYAFGVLITIFLYMFWIQVIGTRYRRRDMYGDGIFDRSQHRIWMAPGLRVGAPHVHRYTRT